MKPVLLLLSSVVFLLLITPVQAQSGCVADFNSDLETNTTDLQLFLPQIYQQNVSFDLNHDTRVNMLDYAQVFAEISAHCKKPLPVTVNSKLLNGTLLPLYRVTDPTASVSAVLYETTPTAISVKDMNGQTIWSKSIEKTGWSSEGAMGGFDFNSDGWLDLALFRSRVIGICGASPLKEMEIIFIDGKVGAMYEPLGPLADKCWNFGSTIYPTSQWTNLSVLFGPGNFSVITVLPYYATQGWFMRWTGAVLSNIDMFYYPSTADYDATYPNAQPNVWTGTKYVENSHTGNGLMIEVAGQKRVVFFTSGRVVQYAVSPLGATQVVADRPFAATGAGRNYGQVSLNPENAAQIALVAGTSAAMVYLDYSAGAVVNDPWGQIERHVAIYNLLTNTIDDKFYSNAHDNGDANQYVGRVAYPAHMWLKTGKTAGSRLAYSVFTEGHWSIHITQPGSTVLGATAPDYLLWDIRDLDGDGIDEMITSPADYARPTAVGIYFPQSQTQIYHWNESTGKMEFVKAYTEGIPFLLSRFRESTRTTSMSYFYDTVSVLDQGQVKFALINAAKQLQLVTY